MVYTQPREVGSIPITVTQGVASAAAHGAAFPTALTTGNFTTTADFPNIDIAFNAFCANSAAQDTSIHIVLDGNCIGMDELKAAVATSGRRITVLTRQPVSPGTHSVAIYGKSAAGGTCYIGGTSGERGLLTVREAG